MRLTLRAFVVAAVLAALATLATPEPAHACVWIGQLIHTVTGINPCGV